MANTENYGTKLFKFWAPSGWSALWLVLALAPLLFFQTFIHEGLHWLTAVSNGADPKLIPFPHFNLRFGASGQNLNGATLNSPGFPATPQLVVAGFVFVISLIFIFLSPPWRLLRLLLTWMFLGFAIDLMFNTGSGLIASTTSTNDWGAFRNLTNVGLTTALAWLFWILILSHFGWIAFSRWHINRPEGAGFFEFKVFAIIMAGLSLIAILFSSLVQDPSIVRNAWFWSIFVWQCLSFCWFVAYVIWASVRRD